MLKPEELKIISNKKLCDKHYVLKLKSKTITKTALPGQFVQIMINEYHDPLLPRPFSFLDIQGESFEILYQVVGLGTKILANKTKGDKLKVLGPLGNGWAEPRGYEYLLVGGGVGIPPIYHWAKEAVKKNKFNAKHISIFLGGRNKKYLHYEKQFKKLGLKIQVATDDGSKGKKGRVTDILKPQLKDNTQCIMACGPTPMLRAISDLADKWEIPCYVSVEEPMPCGFGACLGCAIKIKADSDPANRTTQTAQRNYRYAMSCTEGPVFKSKEIIWES